MNSHSGEISWRDAQGVLRGSGRVSFSLHSLFMKRDVRGWACWPSSLSSVLKVIAKQFPPDCLQGLSKPRLGSKQQEWLDPAPLCRKSRMCCSPGTAGKQSHTVSESSVRDINTLGITGPELSFVNTKALAASQEDGAMFSTLCPSFPLFPQ